MLLHTYIPSFLFGRDQRRFHVTPTPSVRYHHVPMHLTQTRGYFSRPPDPVCGLLRQKFKIPFLGCPNGSEV